MKEITDSFTLYPPRTYNSDYDFIHDINIFKLNKDRRKDMNIMIVDI